MLGSIYTSLCPHNGYRLQLSSCTQHHNARSAFVAVVSELTQSSQTKGCKGFIATIIMYITWRSKACSINIANSLFVPPSPWTCRYSSGDNSSSSFTSMLQSIYKSMPSQRLLSDCSSATVYTTS